MRCGLRVIFLACALSVLPGASALELAVEPPTPPVFDIAMEEAWIPMPDGVRLSADLWRPKGAGDTGRFRVLLEYLPYESARRLLRDGALVCEMAWKQRIPRGCQ